MSHDFEIELPEYVVGVKSEADPVEQRVGDRCFHCLIYYMKCIIPKGCQN